MATATSPLQCRDLVSRRLLNETHCCDHCHDGQTHRTALVALVIPTDRGLLDVEVCCTQARVLSAHAVIPAATQIEEA